MVFFLYNNEYIYKGDIMSLLKIFIAFWFFSILGWILEVIVCSITDKRLVNRGFLIGPYCPIYGFGSLIMLLISPYKDHLFTCFILALTLCSFLEYFASFIMEKLFKIRWWDYSNDAFNINGRICLRNAIAFGALGVIFTRFLNPWYLSIVDNFSYNTLLIISIVFAIITLIDLLVSFNAMNSIRNIISKDLSKYKDKDATNDVKKLISKRLLNINYLQKRLIETYHLLGKEKEIIKRKIKVVNEKTKSGYGLLLVFIILGIVIGLILSLGFNLGSYKIIIPFTLSVSSLLAAIILKVGEK